MLIVDCLYPNKFSRWRNEEIASYITELNADVLVYRVSSYAGINFDFDFDFANRNNLLDDYNILIFDPHFNYINKYNKKIDGTLFNNKFKGSYLLTKNYFFNLDYYDCIYHIFLWSYNKFNNDYKFNIEKQFIHLYPGGGFNGQTNINKNVNVISTHPTTTLNLINNNHKKYIDAWVCPCFQKNDFFIEKKSISNKMTVCFSSLGTNVTKGSNNYIRIAEDYRKKYINDDINFISIGNCEKHPNIISYNPMNYIELSYFYRDNVDIYLNLQTGISFNGFPLGIEALISGCVLMSTDPDNVSHYFNIKSDEIFIENNIDNYCEKIKYFYDNKQMLKIISKKEQTIFYEYISYNSQQKKILDFIKQKI